MSYLQRRLSFLISQIESKKLVLTEDFLASENGQKLIEDIAEIRKFPDGTIDLTTCSPRVRSFARNIYALQRITDLDEKDENAYLTTQSITPEQIMKNMKDYFQMLEDFFIKVTGTPSSKFAINETFSYQIHREAKAIAKRAYQAYSEYIPKIAKFHGENSKILLGSGKSIGGLKCVIGGSSRFPEAAFDGLRKFALYADTIFVPDPILPWIEVQRAEEQFSNVQLLEQTFNLLKLKPLIDAKLPYPAVIVFPSWEKSLETTDEETQDGLAELVLRFFSFYLNATFEDESEVIKYVSSTGQENFKNAVNKYGLFVPPGENEPQQFNVALRNYKSHIKTWRSNSWLKKLGKLSPELIVFNGIAERLSPHFHMNDNAQTLKAQPLFWLEPHFYYFQLLSRADNSNLQDAGLIKPETFLSLQALLKPNHAWLGNVPIKDLAKFREENLNEEFRGKLATYTNELSEAKIDEIDRVAAEVARGIASLMSQHEKEAQKIAEEYKKKHISTLAMGILTIGAILYPSLAPHLGASLSATPIIKYAVDKIHNAAERKQLTHSLTGILSHAKKVNG